MNNHDIDIYYHPNQEKIFGHPAKNKVIAKGRRFGLTKGMANNAIEAMMDGISPILWVDTVATNIERYVERYFIPVLQQLPPSMWKWRQQKKELTVHGSKMDLRSADRPENIEGFAYERIYLNEAGIILKNHYLYENTILPMRMDFDPDLYVGGTPKGQGLFFELFTKAKDPEEKLWEAFHFTSYDNPLVKKEMVDTIANDMPEIVRRQEIFGEFLEDEAFVFRGYKKCYGAEHKDPEKGKSYIMGVDLAKHVDFTVIIVMDSEGRMVYFDRFKEIDWELQKDIIYTVAKKYNDAKVLIDSTGVGDPIYDALLRMKVKVQGYKFTAESKRQLIQNLMLAFETEEIKIFDDKICSVLTYEIQTFSYEISETTGQIRYNAPEGLHDDCVISLALVAWLYKHVARGFIGYKDNFY